MSANPKQKSYGLWIILLILALHCQGCFSAFYLGNHMITGESFPKLYGMNAEAKLYFDFFLFPISLPFAPPAFIIGMFRGLVKELEHPKPPRIQEQEPAQDQKENPIEPVPIPPEPPQPLDSY